MPAVKPAGDVEVQRGSDQGSVHGGGDRGGEQARAQVNKLLLLSPPQYWNFLKIETLEIYENSSPWFGFSRNFSSMVGGVTRNSSGHIIAATSALMVWVLEVSQDSQSKHLLSKLSRWTRPNWAWQALAAGLSLAWRIRPALPGRITLLPLPSTYPPRRSGPFSCKVCKTDN